MILFIHRKDLRIEDMSAFDYILEQQSASVHLLILDPFLLKRDRHLAHSGINFMKHVRRLHQLYRDANKQLHLAYGEPAEVVHALLTQLQFTEVVVHRDFTPYAITRDRKLQQVIDRFHIPFTRIVDHTLIDLADFQRFTTRKDPYQIYTPFYRKWHEYIELHIPLRSRINVCQLTTVNLAEGILDPFLMPFSLTDYSSADDPQHVLDSFVRDHLSHYPHMRDQYAIEGTSLLSRHTNVGAISIRHIYETVHRIDHATPWIRQLAWRDFYIYQSMFNADYFQYEKRYDLSSLNDRYFENWIRATTGIPIIDAAMTELSETGCMPNRLRMVTAMFLAKNLACSFTSGEQYFRHALSDYDNTLNRGGWLWSSSLGFDAAPYFRIMNPVTQSQTHDPSGDYIRKWLPELKDLNNKDIHLPRRHAIVDLKASRAEAIGIYKSILSSASNE